MIIPYCLNIHPGETLEDIRNAITAYALKVKEHIAPDQPYPLGLRLGAGAVDKITEADNTMLFKQLLEKNNLYATGINGFPYGTFHNTAVKSAVYQPDWTSSERLNYTIKLASILSDLLPEGMTGNVSTVPLGYKLDKTAAEAHDCEQLYVKNTAKAAEYLRILHRETGKKITLAIEPEPDCVIGNSTELLNWFERLYDTGDAAREYIGVCLDTCHFAVEYEDPLEVIHKLETADINIARIQLSSAISTTISGNSINALRAFIDTVYLHQTKIQTAENKIVSFPDLTEEVLKIALQYKDATLRTHFHVPLFFEGTQLLQSTHDYLSPEFFAHAVNQKYPLEIETYTFDVLPPEIKPANIIDSLVTEHNWVAEHL
ncbi:MAG: metabolite traffic protein EboE [Kiritimatiellia bacterium]